MKPRIGITSFHEDKDRARRYVVLNERYIISVALGGGLPLCLPVEIRPEDIESYLDGLDGLMLSGGADLSPLLYGRDFSPKTVSVSTRRDQTELALIRAASARGMPILGICRGIQAINVAFGGTLIQDIPAEVPGAVGHASEMIMDELGHFIEAAEGSRLAAVFGSRRFAVNSFHHQALKDIASGFVVTARSADGIVEAMESAEPGRYLTGVQFHPEALTTRYPEFVSLFTDFVSAAARFRR